MSELLSQESYQEFYAESEEIMGRVSQYLTELDGKKQNPNLIDSFYRDIHTVKGTAQLFNFSEIAQIAHAMEASLEPVRRGNLVLSSDWIDSLFACLDLIVRLIKAAKEPSQNPPVEIVLIHFTVSRLIESVVRYFHADVLVAKDTFMTIERQERTSEDLGRLDQMFQSISKNHQQNAPLHHPYLEEPQTDPAIPTEVPMSNPTQPLPIYAEANLTGASGKDDANPPGQDSNSSIRVQVSLLDRLMNLVGEMVLVRNQVLQYSHEHEDFTLLNLSQKLDLVTSELQEEVMKTRMQPIGSILSKFTRFVRELARDLEKQIEISIEGAETELDKTLIEAIKDPITHIIRNACDHGIENPAERRQRGKPPLGKIRVRSQQESGQVVIEVSDDGKGLDSKKLLSKAIEKKLITPEKGPTLTEREIYQLVFLPGFSTAEHVSEVSGRGVGMDVVKTNIEKIGGTVDLKSEPSRGTTIRLKIPLTLAIVPALIVSYQESRFAIPQVKLLELVRVDSAEGQYKLEFLQGKPVFRLRGNLLPLVSLDEVLKEEQGCNLQEKLKNQIENGINIVVLATDSGPFGLIVDEILDTADIVVKPLAKFFKKLLIYSGATIMGDGSVSLIFDVLGIATKANLALNRTRNQDTTQLASHLRARAALESQEMLSFGLKSGGHFSIPLCLVQRLEEFSQSDIETSGNYRIVQYRNAVLPLISLNKMLGFDPSTNEGNVAATSESQKFPVIVVQKCNRLFGIEVNQIIDILMADHEIEDPIHDKPGILGNMIIGKEVSTVIDVLGLIDLITGSNSTSPKKEGSTSGSLSQKNTESKPLRILFAEDTGFFVKQVKKILLAQGYVVTHAVDGEEAFRILESSQPGEFDLVLTDIEMPRMTGFQLAAKIKSIKEFAQIPLIALTTRVREADIEKGKQVGFSRYLEKLKSDQLIEAIQEVSHERTSTH